SPTTLTAYLTTTEGEILAQAGPITNTVLSRQHYGYVFVGSDFQGSVEGVPAYFDNLRFCCAAPAQHRWWSQVI
ncbi:hypothetical protein, partial [Klebsiella pneumoniae]|uniref:hypothetical protein n=1 Tax=Klebsiella pneumoniae TaxID=573 RepID=UPI0022AC3DA5